MPRRSATLYRTRVSDPDGSPRLSQPQPKTSLLAASRLSPDQHRSTLAECCRASSLPDAIAALPGPYVQVPPPSGHRFAAERIGRRAHLGSTLASVPKQVKSEASPNVRKTAQTSGKRPENLPKRPGNGRLTLSPYLRTVRQRPGHLSRSAPSARRVGVRRFSPRTGSWRKSN